MAYEQKNNNGTLFKNDKKDRKNPDHEKLPDYKGDATVNGKQMWMSAWIKTGKNGQFMSISFSDKDAQRSQSNNQQRNQSRSYEEEETPF